MTWETTLVEQVRRNGRLFFRLAYNILRDPAAAEDACQHAFLKACERKAEIRDRSSLQGWLARVVVNQSLEICRRRQVERRVNEQLCREDAAVSTQDGAEFRELFQIALEDLSEPTRTIVALRLIEGVSGNEVKTVMGISASEVSRRFHNGLEHLRRRLDGFR